MVKGPRLTRMHFHYKKEKIPNGKGFTSSQGGGGGSPAGAAAGATGVRVRAAAHPGAAGPRPPSAAAKPSSLWDMFSEIVMFVLCL